MSWRCKGKKRKSETSIDCLEFVVSRFVRALGFGGLSAAKCSKRRRAPATCGRKVATAYHLGGGRGAAIAIKISSPGAQAPFAPRRCISLFTVLLVFFDTSIIHHALTQYVWSASN